MKQMSLMKISLPDLTRRSTKRSRIGLPAAFLISSVITAALLSSCSGNTANPEDVVEGAQSPNFSLTTLDGATLKSSSLKGNAVILNFWATWCQPCQSEMPVLNDIAANTKVRVVGIALDEGGAKIVKPYVISHGINYQVVIGNQEVFEQFNGLAIPYTLVLDRSQRIVKIYRGPITRDEIDKVLKSII
jgi:cytochrome c biogenesis protein CcmG/thiol:disulfide interchange protein DsbE